jgi:hypothetical protein
VVASQKTVILSHVSNLILPFRVVLPLVFFPGSNVCKDFFIQKLDAIGLQIGGNIRQEDLYKRDKENREEFLEEAIMIGQCRHGLLFSKWNRMTRQPFESHCGATAGNQPPNALH